MNKRILIIGNSGAGKSALGHKLVAALTIPLIDLDRLHWEDGGYGRKRPESEARALVMAAAAAADWIIEGVYGWLADVALPRATDLIWLDLPWDVCREGLKARTASASKSAEDCQALLAWAAAYWDRQTSSSFAGHERLFENFTGRKFRIRNRDETDGLIVRLAGDHEG